MPARLINLEDGRPNVETAMMRLRLELSTLRRVGVRTVKVIHGYGSSGTGGAIRQAAHSFLNDQLSQRRIKAFCPGESFGPFENRGRNIVDMASDLRNDPDWGRQNDGITIVVL
ncbi:MAG: hypothetical protein EOM13_01170 [Clostridia bacterium]|nr:hypothetical protein [Clostridia bacterium]